MARAAAPPVTRSLPARAGDSDGDGAPDPFDACPTLPGVRSGVLVLNGCPPAGYYDDGLGLHDRDGDGVLDAVDTCPEDPGPVDGKGCASPPDADADGIPDEQDACRNDAGPRRSDARLAGCPGAWVEKGTIRIAEPVRFASGRAELLPESEPVLALVFAVLARRADILKVSIEGHTDGRGGPVMNRRLALRRAASVAGFLVGKGIAPARLAPVGVGPDRPTDTNDTESGRAMNRRVEFHLVEVTPAPRSGAGLDGVGPTDPLPSTGTDSSSSQGSMPDSSGL